MVGAESQAEGSDKALPYHGFAGGELGGPGHSGGVVNPSRHMLVQHVHKLFQHKVVQQEACHLKVVDGEGAMGIVSCD